MHSHVSSSSKIIVWPMFPPSLWSGEPVPAPSRSLVWKGWGTGPSPLWVTGLEGLGNRSQPPLGHWSGRAGESVPAPTRLLAWKGWGTGPSSLQVTGLEGLGNRSQLPLSHCFGRAGEPVWKGGGTDPSSLQVIGWKGWGTGPRSLVWKAGGLEFALPADLDTVSDDTVKQLCTGGHVFFNCLGTTRARAGSAVSTTPAIAPHQFLPWDALFVWLLYVHTCTVTIIDPCSKWTIHPIVPV